MATSYAYPARRDAPAFDPTAQPEYFDGLLWRRPLAYLVDLMIIGAIWAVVWVAFLILTVLSFGLLHFLWAVLPLIPIAYSTLLLGRPRSATLGMRLFDLEMRTWAGGRPSYLQAAVQTILFYVTVYGTSFLIVLVALVNGRRRMVHDFLAGTVVVRSHPDPVLLDAV